MRKKSLLARLCVEQDWLCFYCGKTATFTAPALDGKKAAPDYPTIDHKIPLGRGGTWAVANLVMACYTCNHRKSDKLVPEVIMGDESLRYKLFRSAMIKRCLL